MEPNPVRVLLLVSGLAVGTVGPAAARRWAAILARVGRVELVGPDGEVIDGKAMDGKAVVDR